VRHYEEIFGKTTLNHLYSTADMIQLTTKARKSKEGIMRRTKCSITKQAAAKATVVRFFRKIQMKARQRSLK